MQWPLAKIKVPIDYLIQRVERLLTGFANEISATQWYPATFDRRVKGQKGQKGAYAGPILEGDKGPAKGDSK